MRAFSLAKKAFLKPFEKDLIYKIGPAYFILIGIGQLTNTLNPVISNGTNLVLFIFTFTISLVLFLCPLIFYPILIQGLRANASKSKFVFPKLRNYCLLETSAYFLDPSVRFILLCQLVQNTIDKDAALGGGVFLGNL